MTADRAPLASDPPLSPDDERAVQLIKELWQDILDKDDRNSPSEYPDMALLTFREFDQAIRLALNILGDKTND